MYCASIGQFTMPRFSSTCPPSDWRLGGYTYTIFNIILAEKQRKFLKWAWHGRTYESWWLSLLLSSSMTTSIRKSLNYGVTESGGLRWRWDVWNTPHALRQDHLQPSPTLYNKVMCLDTEGLSSSGFLLEEECARIHGEASIALPNLRTASSLRL